nr:MAG TPA: hypothetical protein [Caudoviricetes sp.]
MSYFSASKVCLINTLFVYLHCINQVNFTI